jgi:hypothetical protein
MTTTLAKLMISVEAFLSETGVSASELGLRSTNDKALIGRLRAGGKGANPTASTIDAIEAAIRDYHAHGWRKPAKRRMRRFHESRAA